MAIKYDRIDRTGRLTSRLGKDRFKAYICVNGHTCFSAHAMTTCSFCGAPIDSQLTGLRGRPRKAKEHVEAGSSHEA